MPPKGNPQYLIPGAVRKELTLKEKITVAEYLKTGKKASSFKAAYKCTPKNMYSRANTFFRKPKIKSAIEKALQAHHFDEDYAVENLKKIVEGGMQNIDIARPDTALKALELFLKMTNNLGGEKPKDKVDPETLAKKMDITELKKQLKELDKQQKRILAFQETGIEEGEIVE